MLSPYLSNQQKFTNSISSGKYLVILGLKTGRPGIYYFNPIKYLYYTSKIIKENYLNNDIDLSIYLDIKNDIKNKNLKESKIQTIVKTKTEFYFDAGNEEVIYSSFSDLTSQYGDIINLLDDVIYKKDDSDLKWGILKGEYAIYIGQFNNNGLKHGKGLLINPRNIFAGSFYNNLQNGKGCIYNNQKKKLYYCNYQNGRRIGQIISLEEERINRENDLKKEFEKYEEEKRKREQILENIKEEQKKEEERIKEEIERIDLAYIDKLEKEERFKEDVKEQIQKKILEIIKQKEEIEKEKEKKEKLRKEFSKEVEKRVLEIIKQTEEKEKEEKRME